MKDIDFDELDKAVSSVLGTGNKPKQATTAPAAPVPSPSLEPAAPVAAESSAPAVDVAPVVSETKAPEAVEAPAESNVETPAEVAPLSEPPKIITSPAVRRGRFMDVVHPSSDMTSATPAPAPATPSYRSLKPVSADLTSQPEEVATSPEVADVPATESSAEMPVTETTASEESKLDVPDASAELDSPIEHTGVADDDDQTEPATEAAANVESAPDKKADTEVTPPTETAEEESKTDTEMNLDLPDDEELQNLTDDLDAAEVKPADNEPKETPFLTDTKVDKRPLSAFSGEEVPVPASETPDTLPRELDDDVLSIESKESSEPPKQSSGAQDVLLSPENTADDSQLQHMFSSETNHVVPTGKKKTSVWVWVLLIVALLAIGSGLGYLWFVSGF